jgi:hypothetical protein
MRAENASWEWKNLPIKTWEYGNVLRPFARHFDPPARTARLNSSSNNAQTTFHFAHFRACLHIF